MYEAVTAPELLQLFHFLEENTAHGRDAKNNPILYMIDSLIWFMSQMNVSTISSFLARFGWTARQTKERSIIRIHRDHWIVKLIKIDRSGSLKTISQKIELVKKYNL